MQQIKNYWLFLTKILFSKKLFVVIPVILMTIIITASIVFGIVGLQSQAGLAILITAFVEILITIFYASLLYLNIFVDLEKEGIELIASSKSISRKTTFTAKTSYALIFSVAYGVLMVLGNLFISLSLQAYSLMGLYLLITFITFILIFNFFGSITSLIAYYSNSKIALTAPIIVSTPLMVSGVVLSSYSTSVSNNFAYYLNFKYENNLSGNWSNTEKFYLNDKKDNLYIMPNGIDNKAFSQTQIEFLNRAYSEAKIASNGMVAYSWSILPYQFLDLFNLNEQNVFENVSDDKEYTKDYVYHPANQSYLYKYNLEKLNANDLDVNSKFLKLYLVGNPNDKNEENQQKFIIPGALKNYSQKNNVVNTNLIYARENASNFGVSFPEDKYVFGASDNLVGELKWEYLQQVLQDSEFYKYARELFDNLLDNLKQDTEITADGGLNSEDVDLLKVKAKLIQAIENELAKDSGFLVQYQNPSVKVFNENALQDREIKTNTEKKVYLATALLYFVYFNYNDNVLTNAMLSNDSRYNFYTPGQFKLNINGSAYNIGGYRQFTPVQQVSDVDGQKKVVVRYNLEASENFVFQTMDQMYVLEKGAKQVSKIGYIAILTIIVSLLIFFNNYKYSKKDYK
ncbi:ABC transporter permease [Mycoplasma buteonis]|uniref:ABC transporter permease n=1 Tax=Mycoplasma buteonis TaxID=171280 RepID=UPI000569E66D|nr:ABC transporter permease [Mycoplasma buteonis]